MRVTTIKTDTGQRILWALVSPRDTLAHMLRLDAGAYSNTNLGWKKEHGKTKTIVKLETLAEVRQPTIFGKRSMLGTPEKGIPVYSSSDMLHVHPEPAFYLSRRHQTRILDSLAVREGWTLVTRSGSIGYTLYVSSERDGWVVDDHMIRIQPKTPALGSYLYTFLSSPVGQSAIKPLAYGAVQLEIKGTQLADLEVPEPKQDILNTIHARIKRAIEARCESERAMADAERRLYDSLNLPRVLRTKGKDTTAKGTTESFTISAEEALKEDSSCRLDAHFYNPTAQQAIANIRKCREVRTVGEMTGKVFFCNRFTRTFVDKEHGLPYLAGKNIIQIRPNDLAYLSKTETSDLEQYRLQRGWILLTCSGTIGRTCLVWKNFEDYVGTHDMIRIVPDETRLDGGYLNAFLSSQYGQCQILRYKHGSVIDHVTPEQIARVMLPIPSKRDQTAIGDKVREAYDKRAEAIRLEDEAQAILAKELTRSSGSKGV